MYAMPRMICVRAFIAGLVLAPVIASLAVLKCNL
jgi:hypothetical protein